MTLIKMHNIIAWSLHIEIDEDGNEHTKNALSSHTEIDKYTTVEEEV